jgi:hypothetical protein
MTALEDGARHEQLLKRRDNLRPHSVSARGQQLHDCDIVVAVNHHTGEAIAVAIEQAVAIGIGGYHPAAKYKRLLYPVRYDVCRLDAIAEREHPQRNSCGRIEIAEAQALSAGIENFHAIAWGKLAGLCSCNRLRENPRIPTPHGSVTILLEYDAAGNFHASVLPESALAPKWCLVVTVAIRGKLDLCIIVQSADLKIPKA